MSNDMFLVLIGNVAFYARRVYRKALCNGLASVCPPVRYVCPVGILTVTRQRAAWYACDAASVPFGETDILAHPAMSTFAHLVPWKYRWRDITKVTWSTCWYDSTTWCAATTMASLATVCLSWTTLLSSTATLLHPPGRFSLDDRLAVSMLQAKVKYLASRELTSSTKSSVKCTLCIVVVVVIMFRHRFYAHCINTVAKRLFNSGVWEL